MAWKTSAQPILCPRERHRAVAANAAKRRPQAGHTADRGRAEDRAAGFRADAERDASSRGRARRTSRRSAGSFGRIPRAVGSPAEPLIARRQFSGRQLGEHDRARFAQQAHHSRLGVDHLSFESAGSPLRRKTGDRDDVLASPRHAVQRPAVLSRRYLAVGLLRLLHRQFVGVRHDEVQRGVEAAETVEIHARELDRGHLTSLEQLGEMGERPERGVFEVGGTLQRRRRARAEWLRHAIEPCARHDGAEVHRRRDVGVDRDLPQIRVARQVLVHAVEDLLALFVGEVEARHREGILEHRAGDVRGVLLLHAGPQDAWEERGGQAGAREVREESPSGCGRIRHTTRMLPPGKEKGRRSLDRRPSGISEFRIQISDCE